jgi:SAM-dependent methyltransferase
MAIEQRDWYDTPLYYDIIFDADTPQEATFLDQLWRRHARTRHIGTPRSLEAACGSGRLMAEMLSNGWQTHGFDLSPAMLDHARQRLQPRSNTKPKPRLWQDAMQSFTARPNHYHLVHCLVSTFKYLLTEADAQAALRRMADALLPGGLLVLGLHLTDYQRSTCEHERWVQQRDGIHVVCNTRTWPPHSRKRTEQVRTRLKIRHPGHPTRTQETHWTFRTYSAAQLKRTLATATPDLELVSCYDFHYRIDQPRQFDDSYADIILVLKKTIT